MDQSQFLSPNYGNTQHTHLNQHNASNNIPQVDIPPPKTADIFSFDDLLITCAHEIMLNGINSTVIPPTIKDWISGKIVDALPHRLVQKLLGFLIDNRDMTETIAFKEKNHGEVPEFTLLLYRTAKAKIRHESKNSGANLENKQFSTANDKPLFDEKELNGEGIKFCSDEIIVEQSQIIPLNKIPVLDQLMLKTKDMRRSNKSKQKSISKRKKYDSDNSVISENSALDSDSENEITKTGIKRKKWGTRKVKILEEKIRDYEENIGALDSGLLNLSKKDDPYAKHLVEQEIDPITGLVTSKNNGRPKLFDSKYGNYECNLCDFKHHRRDILYKHQKEEHPTFWKDKMKEEKSWPGSVTKQVLSDEYTEITYLPDEKMYHCVLCGMKNGIAARLKIHVDTVHRRIKQSECPICGKQFQWKTQLKKHMCVHTGEYPYRCEICDKGYMTRNKYREEHQKKHHYDDYIVWKVEDLRQKEEAKQLREAKKTGRGPHRLGKPVKSIIEIRKGE